ncbi:MAG: hypothetical protein Q9212_003299 [Teloschistes hypoglaucus]
MAPSASIKDYLCSYRITVTNFIRYVSRKEQRDPVRQPRAFASIFYSAGNPKAYIAPQAKRAICPAKRASTSRLPSSNSSGDLINPGTLKNRGKKWKEYPTARKWLAHLIAGYLHLLIYWSTHREFVSISGRRQFQMPGTHSSGDVLLFSGNFPAADTDDKVAIVLGHEIAHVLACYKAAELSAGLFGAFTILPI